jgi:hypothetical protein
MGVLEILAGLFHRKPGRDGVWDFLSKRSADKGRVELEKMRSDATQKLIPLLRPGTVLVEGGPDWFREIRVPEAIPPGPLHGIPQPPIPLPSPPDEVEPAPGRATDQRMIPANERASLRDRSRRP